jgi:predicted acyl esterase
MQEGSKPVYKMKVEKNVLVRMRDGVRIACDVYYPDAQGRFPAILSMGPYGKDIQALKAPPQPRHRSEWGAIEAGNSGFLVSRGYVHVIVDVRGTGFSEGNYDICQMKEQQDGYELVLSRGWLKASHRELDEEKSQLWQPYHPHTSAVPVIPGEINQYAIEIRPIANLFRKGHKIKLEIWGCDYPSDPVDLTLSWPLWSHLSYDKEVAYKIYHGTKHPSRLILPITG